MDITVKTKKMAVIGDPIAHSLSPFMHNSIIAENGYDAFYIPVHVTSDILPDFCAAARVMGFAGFNATMPHKQALLKLVDEVDPEAREYGAVNTVKITPDGRLIGYNTDVRGLFTSFEGQGIALAGARIMILGAGGVAGSLIKGAAKKDVASVTVFNRTFDKADQICASLPYAQALEQTPENLARAAKDADIILNCTSLGMTGTDSDHDDLSFLEGSQALLCDLIYNPWETSFLAKGRELGLKTINGMDMLIYQGLFAFEIFMDTKLDLQKERDRLLPMCREQLLAAE